MDHYYLQFWPWACVADGEDFLRASSEYAAITKALRITPHSEWIEKRKLAQAHMELAKYHFVSTMGSLLRHMKPTHSLFPDIKSAWDKAQHLQKEGKDLRDMIEHSDQYRAGEGRKQDSFFREPEGAPLNLPGDRPGIADATSLIVKSDGHWLGGRLNVERIVAEARLILSEAEKISAPVPHRAPRPIG